MNEEDIWKPIAEYKPESEEKNMDEIVKDFLNSIYGSFLFSFPPPEGRD